MNKINSKISSTLKNYQSGFIRTLILIVVILILLSYFNIDVRRILTTKPVSDIIKIFVTVVKSVFFIFLELLRGAWSILVKIWYYFISHLPQ